MSSYFSNLLPHPTFLPWSFTLGLHCPDHSDTRELCCPLCWSWLGPGWTLPLSAFSIGLRVSYSLGLDVGLSAFWNPLQPFLLNLFGKRTLLMIPEVKEQGLACSFFSVFTSVRWEWNPFEPHRCHIHIKDGFWVHLSLCFPTCAESNCQPRRVFWKEYTLFF